MSHTHTHSTHTHDSTHEETRRGPFRRVRSWGWYLLTLARARKHKVMLVSEDTARAYLTEHQHAETWLSSWS